MLILLDELPPYFENARSRSIGNSDLAQVTATALSNLLVAIGRPSCSRVCLVITDLAAAYQRGSGYISAVLNDFEAETTRSAMSLEPVRLNSDELYHILRTRIFESLPAESEVNDVAQGYAKAIRAARQMAITSESPEEFANRITSSYPFHPGIRDLYARFRENQGFQQTRGLIRLMRIVAARLWNTGEAKDSYLIAAHDLDLNDQETRAEIGQINNTLDNAIAHDIASEGSAVAENMDANLGTRDATDACKRADVVPGKRPQRSVGPLHPRVGRIPLRTGPRPVAAEVRRLGKTLHGSLVSPQYARRQALLQERPEPDRQIGGSGKDIPGRAGGQGTP